MNLATQEGSAAEAVEQKGEGRAGKYLTFILAEEQYGIDVLSIQEIIGMMPITSVPQTPEYVKGVVNLRGKVIPVIDLRLRFGMQERKADGQTCVIVVDVSGVQMGVVVDTVREVLDIGEDEIESAPRFGTKVDTRYIRGLGKLEEKIAILLDINRVLTQEDLVMVEAIQRDGEAPSENERGQL